MSDDWRIPTKNELREAIDKAHDAEVKSLRDELARVTRERDEMADRKRFANEFVITFQQDIERLRKIQTDEGRLQLIELLDKWNSDLEAQLAAAAAAVAERDAAKQLLEPFARMIDEFVTHLQDNVTIRIAVQTSTHPDIERRLTVGQFRRAAALVARHDTVEGK